MLFTVQVPCKEITYLTKYAKNNPFLHESPQKNTGTTIGMKNANTK